MQHIQAKLKNIDKFVSNLFPGGPGYYGGGPGYYGGGPGYYGGDYGGTISEILMTKFNYMLYFLQAITTTIIITDDEEASDEEVVSVLDSAAQGKIIEIQSIKQSNLRIFFSLQIFQINTESQCHRINNLLKTKNCFLLFSALLPTCVYRNFFVFFVYSVP